MKRISFVLVIIFLLLTLKGYSQHQMIRNILTEDFLVNDDTTLSNIEHKFSAIALNSVGDFTITWMDYRLGYNDIYFQQFSSNGTKINFNIKVNDDTSGRGQAIPSIAMDGNGNFVIVWLDDRNNNFDIYFQRYNSIGIPQGVNIKVNDDVVNAFQDNPCVAMDGSGNFVIAWTDNRNSNRDIYFQRYNASGIPDGVNIKVNNDTGTKLQDSPSIAIDNLGNFVITWHDERNNNLDIYFQRYNSLGIPQGNNIKVNDDAGLKIQGDPSIAMDVLGNFVITWLDDRNDDSDIYFQRYNSLGIPQGNNIKVNDDAGTEGQFHPSVAMDEVGNFVIVWIDNRYYLYKPDVFAQRFYSNGSPWGVNYRVVIDGINHGEAYPVTAANASQIIFSWMDNRRNAYSYWDIYGKIVDWNWDGVTSILSEDNIPATFSLSQNFPNPFNPSTKISWQSPVGSHQTLKVFDLLGNEVVTLVNEYKPAGKYEVEFNASALSSGVYFYQLFVSALQSKDGKVGDYVQTKKMVLLR